MVFAAWAWTASIIRVDFLKYVWQISAFLINLCRTWHFCSLTSRIMAENALPLLADLRKPDGPGDLCTEHPELSPIGLTDQAADLLRVIRPGFHHREKYPADP